MTALERRSLVVDARSLHASGIGRYLRGVLVRILAEPRFGRVTLLGRPDDLEAFVADREVAGEVVVVRHDGGTYSPRAQLSWIRQSLGEGLRANAYFFPHYDTPALLPAGRSVVTIHDLTHFKVPEIFPAWKRHLAARLLDRAAARAARVITVSECSRRDLVERFPAAAGKIEVVPNGVDPSFRPWTEGAPPRPEWRSLEPFLLVVGTRKRHKNLAAAVEALALLRAARPELRLVVAGGGAGDDWAEVLARAEGLGVAGAVVDAGRVTDAELRFLYSRCEVFLFPSLYEGFGYPALEAMGCGAPVVASDAASLPEVVGDAGVLVDPHDPRALAAAVERVRGDAALRAELVGRGRERACELSEERAASRTVEILLRVAGERLQPPVAAAHPSSSPARNP